MEGGKGAEGLPVQFYDLRYSYLDVDEALRVWAEGGDLYWGRGGDA